MNTHAIKCLINYFATIEYFHIYVVVSYAGFVENTKPNRCDKPGFLFSIRSDDEPLISLTLSSRVLKLYFLMKKHYII